MAVFSTPDFDDHEEVHFVSDNTSGLKAIIAIHSTVLGPALGGCRIFDYANDEEAIADVLRLSRGMTYKAALLDVKLGGGKSVIIGDPKLIKTPTLFKAMGEAIAGLGGRYIAGADIGSNTSDMRDIALRTAYVSCVDKDHGGYGNPAPLTALGVFSALRAGVESVFKTGDFSGLRIAIQGIGSVGMHLCKQLHDAGAELIVTDVVDRNLDWAENELGAQVVGVEDIYDVEADVFSPCSIGAVINDNTIHRLKVKIVCGAANNQLADTYHSDILANSGVIYIPDYVVNAGGLANCNAEWYGLGPDWVKSKVLSIYDTCKLLLEESGLTHQTPLSVANGIAMARLRGIN